MNADVIAEEFLAKVNSLKVELKMPEQTPKYSRRVSITFEYSSAEELTEKLKKLKLIEESQLPSSDLEASSTLILHL